MKLKKAAALTLCAAMLAGMTGCGGGSSSSSETAKTAENSGSGETKAAGETEAQASAAEKKDEIHIALSANPPSLDAQAVNSNIVAEIGYNIYEPLFAMNENFEPTPVLAESYEVSDDGMVYTIKLRQGVKFHNGDEMNADDVVASLTRWLQVSPKAKTLIDGSIFEKVDDYTIKMTVNEPSSDIMMILASPIQFGAIYPKEVVEAAGTDMITDFIGTGPYKLDEWKQDQYVKLVKNEDYQASPDASTGLAGVKSCATPTLYFDVVTDTSTRIAGIQSGEYDIAEEIPADNYAQLAQNPDLSMSVQRGGTLNLFLNTTEGIMANQDMRQAVLAALNCDDILMASYGDPDLYSTDPGWCVPTDAQWGTDAGKEYYNQNNPEKAKELLQKAGYNNEKLVLVTTPDYAEMYNATLVVQEQLKQVGINAEIESYDFSTFMEHRANPKQFSMYITSNSYNMLPIQLSVLDKGWAGLDAPEVAEGIEKIRHAASTEEASKAWADLQEFLYEYGAATVLGHFTGAAALNKTVEGYTYTRFPIYWNVTVDK